MTDAVDELTDVQKVTCAVILAPLGNYKVELSVSEAVCNIVATQVIERDDQSDAVKGLGMMLEEIEAKCAELRSLIRCHYVKDRLAPRRWEGVDGEIVCCECTTCQKMRGFEI